MKKGNCGEAAVITVFLLLASRCISVHSRRNRLSVNGRNTFSVINDRMLPTRIFAFLTRKVKKFISKLCQQSCV